MNRYAAFLKIVELGSFTKAAELLGYTQPAMSQMIASLENELSIKLLYRSRYGVRLTPEGERLFPSVQTAVAQYNAMQNIAGEIRGLDVSILPELVLRKQSYDIVMLPTEPMVMRRISIITREKNELSVAAKRFIAFLIENMENLP